MTNQAPRPFDDALQALYKTDQEEHLREIVIQALGVCPPERLALGKAYLADILQKKYYAETRQAGLNGPIIQEIDKKYYNLSRILRNTPSDPLPNTTSLPVKSQPAGVGGLGAVLLQNWFSKRKTALTRIGVFGVTLGGLACLYNKFWGSTATKTEEAPPKLSTEDKFEKTLKTLEKILALNQMSQSTSSMSGQDYSKMLKNPKKLIRMDRKSDANKKTNRLDQETKHLFSEMDQAGKLLETRAKIKFSLPSFEDQPLPKLSSNPLPPLFSAFGKQDKNDDSISEPVRRRPRKPREPKEVKEEAVTTKEPPTDPLVEDTSPKVKVKESKTKEPLALPGKIISIDKRNKKVRKVTE